MTTKNETQKPINSKMYFIEKAYWKKGENFMTVAVEDIDRSLIPVGYIRLDGYDVNERPVFSSRDLAGKELYERTANLYQLKRKFRDSEKELTHAMQEYTISKEQSTRESVEHGVLVEESESGTQTDGDESQSVEDFKCVEQVNDSANHEEKELRTIHKNSGKEKHRDRTNEKDGRGIGR